MQLLLDHQCASQTVELHRTLNQTTWRKPHNIVQKEVTRSLKAKQSKRQKSLLVESLEIFFFEREVLRPFHFAQRLRFNQRSSISDTYTNIHLRQNVWPCFVHKLLDTEYTVPKCLKMRTLKSLSFWYETKREKKTRPVRREKGSSASRKRWKICRQYYRTCYSSRRTRRRNRREQAGDVKRRESNGRKASKQPLGDSEQRSLRMGEEDSIWVWGQESYKFSTWWTLSRFEEGLGFSGQNMAMRWWRWWWWDV